MSEKRFVGHFSCGAASAVAIKLAIEENKRRAHLPFVVVNQHIKQEHADNQRFLKDCERWFGVEVQQVAHPLYQGDIYAAFEGEKYISGIGGAVCTRTLKKEVAAKFWQPGDIDVLGYTAEEEDRYNRWIDANNHRRAKPILIDRGLTKQDCLAMVERAGIELPVMYKLGYEHNNCFEGATRFLTDMGTRRLDEAVGEIVRVRGVGGAWKEATIQSFGIQRLMKLTLQRPGREKIVYATPGHRWFVKQSTHGAKVERRTDELKAGDKLASVYGRLSAVVRPSPFGVAQGIVFGDGTRGNTLNTAAVLVLCGEKNKELLPYFSMCPTGEKDAGIEVRDLPRFWKDLPRLDDCQSFLFGWLAGYFAADGCVSSDGSYVLSSAKRDHLEFARDVAVRLGIGSHEIRQVERIGTGTEETTLYSLPLIGATLREDFFILKGHRERFVSSSPRDAHQWAVISVEETDRVEEVFCAVVPDGQAFTLEGNILTGNCIGCVKAGSGYWNKIRVDFPTEFQKMAEYSRSKGVRLLKRGEERIYLDELLPGEGNYQQEPEVQCGIFCELAEREYT
jgi:hypothetical protein